MDKNSIIGIILILLIIVGFSIYNRPSQEQLARQQAYQDSIRQAQNDESNAATTTVTIAMSDGTANADSAANDSVREMNEMASRYAEFAPAATAEEQIITLENSKLKLQMTTRGGRILSAELKDYKTHDSLPLMLFDGDESEFSVLLSTRNSRTFSSDELNFTPQPITLNADSSQTLVMRLTTSADAYLDFIYTLPKDDYMVGMKMQGHNLSAVMPGNINSLDIKWNAKIRQQEQGRKFEQRYAKLDYKYMDESGIEGLSESKNDHERAAGQVQWIAFKDQFFSSVLIADKGFSAADMASNMEDEPYMKSYSTELETAFDVHSDNPTTFRWYLGPNKYSLLRSYNEQTAEGDSKLNLQKLVPLGSWWYAWVNRIAVIPMFNLFSRWFSSFGIIILLMTIVIKLVIFPMTFKSYQSSAKMRVLKPEMDKINEKFPPEKMQERQQATMSLYRKAGVSPMSGCLPMLLQMPILIAMFSFFPTAIELRQQSFLWAHDLSTYDAIFTWQAHIPLISWFFGNHISLFCLLMTITNIAYTYLNMQSQGGGMDGQMKAMKWMMYLMPVFFMYLFNDYAAGLSYYYFVSLLITIIQTMLIRAFTDDKKILAQIHAKMDKNEKNSKKKSGFAARLERMQKEQQQYARKMADERARKYGR